VSKRLLKDLYPYTWPHFSLFINNLGTWSPTLKQKLNIW